jgi:hypothetical protein
MTGNKRYAVKTAKLKINGGRNTGLRIIFNRTAQWLETG